MRVENVTAVIVTRGGGDIDLRPVLATLADFREVLIWDNSLPALVKLTSKRIAFLKTAEPYQAQAQVVDHQDEKVYGRYLGAMEAFEDWLRAPGPERQPGSPFVAGMKLPFMVYVQDDDCITDPPRIVESYGPRDHLSGTVLCNMPEAFRPGYADGVALVGFGAVFNVELIMPAFAKYLRKYPLDDFFRTECDRIFTKLNRLRFVDVPVDRLACSWDPSRLWRRDGHASALEEVRRRLEGIA